MKQQIKENGSVNNVVCLEKCTMLQSFQIALVTSRYTAHSTGGILCKTGHTIV